MRSIFILPFFSLLDYVLYLRFISLLVSVVVGTATRPHCILLYSLLIVMFYFYRTDRHCKRTMSLCYYCTLYRQKAEGDSSFKEIISHYGKVAWVCRLMSLPRVKKNELGLFPKKKFRLASACIVAVISWRTEPIAKINGHVFFAIF